MLEISTNVLVITDDRLLADSIHARLTQLSYFCDIQSDGASAVEAVSNNNYKVVLLDLALSDGSALGILRCIHEADENLNVIMMTPIDFQQERLAGLEAGADDFILKPIQMAELKARIEASLVRSRTKPKTRLEHTDLRMDLTNRTVQRGERQISLTPTEFRILEILMRNQGRVVTRRMLCEFLWNPDWEGVTNVIEVHINRLRTKINQDGDQQVIHTVRGSGYILRTPESAPPTPIGSRQSTAYA